MPQAIVADGPRRSWTITLGLIEGYSDGEGEPHTVNHVIHLHHQWQRERDVVLGCTITPTTISYAYLLEGHLIGSTEPGVIVAGDINVLYQAGVSNDEASDHVLSLALYLGRYLRQRRVYATFGAWAYVLEPERDGEG